MNNLEPITINIGGQERELRFSLGSLKRLKKKFGVSTLKELDGKFKEDGITDLLWEALHDEEGKPPADLTPDKLDNLIDVRHIQEVTQKVGQVFNASNQPKNEEAQTAGPVLVQTEPSLESLTTGSISTQSPESTSD